MIKVIVGPPCAGKSTYVEQSHSFGDVLVDYDKLARALGAREPHVAPAWVRYVALEIRKMAIELIVNGDVSADAWIIHTSPLPEQIEAYQKSDVEFILVDPGIDACLERAEQDARPDGTKEVIEAWYESPPELDYMEIIGQ